MTKSEMAQLLRIAGQTGIAIDPLRNSIGIENIEMAYEIQKENIQHRIDNGARVIGSKIGLTSLAVQKQLGVDQPDFGILLDDMEVLNGLSVPADKLLQPKAEAELAFVLSEDLDYERLTIIDLMSCIDYVLPAIEIVGSRIKDWDIKFVDTVADNASASHFVLGHTPKTLDEIDVVACTMKMYKNDVLSSEGIGSACLGSPLNALLWLAKKMLALGKPLEEGQLVLSGAIGPMVNISKGDHIRAEILGLGQVSFTVD